MAAVHPDVEALIAAAKAAGTKPFEALSPGDARAAAAARRIALQWPPEPVSEASDIALDTPDGPVAMRLYRPADTAADTALPCLVYIHGGGWVFGDLDSHDALCRRLANQARCCVISVHYRLAPEHPFPAAIEDCVAAWAAITTGPGRFRIDASRIAIGGDSAGGALAATIALMARDGDFAAPLHQLLIYPAVDLDRTLADYGPNTPGMTITGATMIYFRDHYLPRPADRRDWRASPIRASSFAGLAPALVITCGHDPLSAEGAALARRLAEAGVRVNHLHLSDQTHGMITMTRAIRTATGLQDYVAGTLREVFGRFETPFGKEARTEQV